MSRCSCTGEMTKGDIRALMLAKRQGLEPEWIAARSAAACGKLMELPEFADAGTVGCYLAAAGEVDTRKLLERCWAESKLMCAPAKNKGSGRYGLVRIEKDTRLVAGAAGIMEPCDKRWIEIEAVDLMVVPGVAFDIAGGRVGHGRGHYDMMMGGSTGGEMFKAGLAFDFQVLECVPMEPKDVRLDVVVTETRVIRISCACCAGKKGRGQP